MDLPILKLRNEDFEINFEIFKDNVESKTLNDGRLQKVLVELDQIDICLKSNESRIDELNDEIKRLTNEADVIDYIVAAASGILAGFIDSFWVGEFNLKEGKAWSNKTVNEFVMKVAKSKGYSGERLDGAIRFLENKFPSPTDNIFKGANVGISTKSHHLDDFTHHPTPIGLFFSILSQFTKKANFQNSAGDFFSIEIDESGSGIIGNDIPSKIFAGTVNWCFHLVSDMSGSNKTAGVGMGIPGPIVSLLKEISLIPGVKKFNLAKKVKDIFVKERFDFRSELSSVHELGRQAVPVIINEVIVRTFYFIRRFINELKKKKDFNKIEWKNTLPWKNRTIVRMLTISTGTFTLFDLTDSAIRAFINSGGEPTLFAKEFIIRINFVGIGRFTLAISSDFVMQIKKEKLRNERIGILNQQLHLLNAKIFYKQCETWIAAESTEQAIRETYSEMEQAIKFSFNSFKENSESMKNIGNFRNGINQNNPTLIDEILNTIKWG